MQKLGATPTELEDQEKSVTFAFGHIVGSGIQYVLEGNTREQWMFKLFCEWEPDLLADDPKRKKSFWTGILAIRQFEAMLSNGFLEDWELVVYKGKPACELSFLIELPDGFKYRGFLDAVLQNKTTGEVMVLENKTTAASYVHPAQYKNSSQAIGYSVVLDVLFPQLSSYKVLYLIYQTKSEEFIQMPFDKSYYQRALWIKELLMDIENIKMYMQEDIFPLHGESCFRFGRPCPFFEVCNLPTQYLTAPLTKEDLDKIQEELDSYQITVTLEDLITAQLNKDTSPPPLQQTEFIF